jgi:adenylyltransferase/sulfurtransferase
MRPVRVIVPTPLRQYAAGADAVELEAATVSDALARLTSRHAELRRHLYAEDGRLRSFVNVYLNDEDIRYLEGGADAPLKAGDEIRIVPSIAGGAPAATEVEPVELSSREIQRYARHLVMPEVGREGQERLKAARVLIVGAGGLGSPAALYLAAAGIGRLGLVDYDVVEYSNLQRQIIHGTKDVGRTKLDSARDRLQDVNPEIDVVTHEARLSSENALEILGAYEVVIDGTDNFPTRYLVNDACVLLDKPNVYGSIFRFEGQVSVFHAKEGPCYRCLFREPPPPGLVPTCAEGGVLGVLPGVIGTLQANEAIKLILGQGEPLIGRLLLFDALRLRFRELRLRKDPECPICGTQPTIRSLIDYEAFCGLKQPGAAAPRDSAVPQVTATQLKARLDAGARLRLIDVREPHEWSICRLDAAEAIPLWEFPRALERLDREEEIVVICRSGSRSALIVRMMQEAGFRKAFNLAGGLLAWADEVDPAMQRY